MKAFLRPQYENVLKMLEECIAKYPDDLWADTGYQNPAWHVAYHALYYTNIYLAPTEDEIRHWPEEQAELHYLASSAHPEYSGVFKKAVPYSRDEMISFLGLIRQYLSQYLQNLDPHAPAWPSWYDQPRGEFHINNLRHLQHHTGELQERINSRRTTTNEWF